MLTEVLSESGLFEASERSRHVGFVVGVDENGSCLQSLAYIHGLIDITGEDPRGQTELCVIGSSKNIIHITKTQELEML